MAISLDKITALVLLGVYAAVQAARAGVTRLAVGQRAPLLGCARKDWEWFCDPEGASLKMSYVFWDSAAPLILATSHILKSCIFDDQVKR